MMVVFNTEAHMNVHYHFDKHPETEGLTFEGLKIHQVGDLFCKYNTVVGEHLQNCAELTCVISGRGTTKINGREYLLRPGEINIVFPGDMHEITSDSVDPLRYYFLGFSVLEGHPLYSALQSLHSRQANGERFFTDELNLRSTISNALAELYSPNEFSKILIETYITQILIYTLQSFDGIYPSYKPDLNDKKKLAFSMVNYIDKNIESVQSIHDVYKNFGYSESYLAHIFTSAVGTSPSDYLHDAKMELAQRLLRQNGSVTRTAELLGYSSIHPFCRAFKKKFGISPSSFIEQ
jgi:AraC-like DNA-binding protein